LAMRRAVTFFAEIIEILEIYDAFQDF
jgi:hypothetical protein